MRICIGKSADDIFFYLDQGRISEVIKVFDGYIVTTWRSGRKLLGFEIAEADPSRTASGDIIEAQRLLRSNGLLEGGSLYEPGGALSQDGVNGPATRRALQIFQALVQHAGNDGVLDGLSDRVTPALLDVLRQFENTVLWSRIDQDRIAVIDWPAPGGDVYDGFGSQGWASVLRAFAADFGGPLAVNDVSLPSGGPFVTCSGQKLHDTHQTGVDIDFPLPSVDGSLRRLTWQDPDYDRPKMRRFLQIVDRSMIASRVWFNDPELIAEGLCTKLEYHEDHVHVRLKEPVPSVSEQEARDFWWAKVAQDQPDPKLLDMVEYLRELKIDCYHPAGRHLYSLSGSIQFLQGVPYVRENSAAVVVAVQDRQVMSVQSISATILPDYILFNIAGDKARQFRVPRNSTIVFDAASMPFPIHGSALSACTA